STDVTNSHDINELYLFLKNYLDKTQ
ncbi:TPA: hypothetical protein ACRU7V_000729, partial [Staphylococcus aureus]